MEKSVLGRRKPSLFRGELFRPSDKNWNELIGEIADAFNMLDQITFLLGAQAAVNHVREHKIFRQSMRIRKEKLAA